MGALDWLSQSVDWAKNRWHEDWHDLRKTFKESWTGLPESMNGINHGLVGMATAPFKDDGDFWGSARMWADSSVGLASKVGGGTIGTLFQIPVLHEASWLLDKAYRYGIARPIATQFLMATNSVRDAYMQGSFSPSTLAESLLTFNAYRRAWNDSAYVTPGQAIVYEASMAYQGVTNGFEDSMKWAETYDPRTGEGQMHYNSADANTWLKYGSGTLDFAANIFADPGHGGSELYKLGKLHLVDKVADARYVMSGKVHQELGSANNKKLRLLAIASDTPEEFGQLSMPSARKRGQIQTLFWSAARRSDDIWADTYLTVRAGDPAAFGRLAESAPDIAASFGDMFANFTIRDFDYQRGKIANGLGADALQKAKFDAFIDSVAANEGLWGGATGIGFREKMPRASWTKEGPAGPLISRMRVGYHNWVLNDAPVIVGRPLANLMTSQGHTPLIDSMDSTAFSARQFRANIERSSTADHQVLSPEEVNGWAGWYGAATSDATRHTIAMRVDNLIIARTLERFGLSKEQLPAVLDEANRWRNGVRRITSNEKVYISEAVARRAEAHAAAGNKQAAALAMQFGEDWKAKVAAGEVSDGYTLWTNVDGRLDIVDAGGVGATNLPVLRSQFGSSIAMLDYRALRGALRWWKLTHPEPKAGLWRTALGEAAKARGLYEASIGALDSISSMWKASALLRPAQAPRNIASDTALTIAEFGKLPVMMAAAQGVVNSLRNFGTRGRLLHEHAQEMLARRRMDGTENLDATADVDVSVPGNASDMGPGTSKPYMSYTQQYADGGLTLHAYANLLDDMFRNSEVEVYSKKKPEAAKKKIPELFKFGATKDLVAEQRASTELGGNRPERIDPDAIPGIKGRLPSVPEGRAAELEANPETFAPNPDVWMPTGQGTPAPSTPRKGLVAGEGSEKLGGRPGREHPEGWSSERRDMKPDVEYAPGEVVGFSVGAGGARGRGPKVEAPFSGQYRVGRPYFVEYTKWRQLQAEQISPEAYYRALTANAIASNGYGVYRQAPWGFRLLKDLLTKHLNRRNMEGYADNPYAPGTVVVDPFKGTSPDIAMKDLRTHFDISAEEVLPTRNVKGPMGKKRVGTLGSVMRGDARLAMVAWIDANTDQLLRPDTQMSLRVKPDGNISVGFAVAKPETIAAGHTIKTGAKERLKNLRYDGIRDMGHTGLKINVGGGRTVDLPGIFEGPEGAELQSRISARDNPATQFAGLVRDIDVEHMLEEPGLQKIMKATDPDYPMSYERDLNAQLASDPVASLFLTPKRNGQFRTLEEVISEVEDTPQGNKWIHAMSFDGVAYVDKIDQIHKMVESYAPFTGVSDELKAKATALRVAASQKKATYKMLEDLFRDDNGKVVLDDLPQIHGASVLHVTGNSRAWKFLRQSVANAQKIISDMPVDKLARFPFMAMAYKRHATELAKVAGHFYRDAEAIPARVVDHIKEASRERAYHDTRYRLYDTAQRNDIAAATRLLMPFSAAMMDSYIKYGRVIRENPMLLVQGAYYWDTFERNEMVQDENGNILRRLSDGGEHWFSVDPKTGEWTVVQPENVGQHRYIQFQLPAALQRALGRKYYGVDAKPVFAINKETMNVFLNVPSGGPLVALPANEFALHNPEFGEDATVKKFLLPFGPSSSRGRVFLPSTVRTAWDAFLAQDGDTAAGHAAAIMQAELIGYGLHTRNTPPTFEEVREKANSLRFLRFMATAVSPASFQLNSPYQPYVDSYRQLVAENPQTAAEEFMKRNGDEFYAVTMSVTRNNAGLSATLESSKAYDKYKDLIAQYPEFGGLIVGSEGAGVFAKSVYEAQKETPVGPGDSRTIREMLDLKSSTQDLNKKTVWSQYSQMMDLIKAAMTDRGLRSLRDKGGKDLADAKTAFVDKNKYWTDPATGNKTLSPWYLDFMSSDRGQIERKFEALETIASDPQLQQRDDIRGLILYLTYRKKMQAEMSYWGVKSLGGKGQSGGMQEKWERQVNNIVEQNPAFASLWNRWLSNDSTLDLPPVPDQPYPARLAPRS